MLDSPRKTLHFFWSHGPLFGTPRQFVFGVMGLFFGPLKELMSECTQDICSGKLRLNPESVSGTRWGELRGITVVC